MQSYGDKRMAVGEKGGHLFVQVASATVTRYGLSRGLLGLKYDKINTSDSDSLHACVVSHTSVHTMHTYVSSFSMSIATTVLCNSIKYRLKLEISRNNYPGIF